MLSKSIFLLAGWVLIAAPYSSAQSVTPSSGAASLPVAVPCGTAGLRSCNAVLQGGAFTNGSTQTATGGAQKVSGIQTLINSTIQKQVDCQAQGVDQSLMLASDAQISQLNGPNPPKCVGQPFGNPQANAYACDLVANPFNLGMSEVTTNHEQLSCGVPANIVVNANITYTLGIPTAVSITTTNNVDLFKSQEFSYVHGALMQAESCFYTQVMNEMNGTQHQVMSNQFSGGAPDPCRALAENVNQVQSVYTSQIEVMISQLSNGLSAQANISDIMNCQNDFQTNAGTGGNSITPDVGSLRQSAQQLCGTRSSLETAFGHFAACEVFSRSQNAWVNLFGDSSKVTANLLNPMIDRNSPSSVNSICSNQCQNQCKSSGSIPAAEACVNSCANSCYQKQMPIFVKNLIENYFPNSGGCSS